MEIFSTLASAVIAISSTIGNSDNYIQERISTQNIMNCANVTVLTHGMGGRADDWIRKGEVFVDGEPINAFFIDEWTLPYQLTSAVDRFDDNEERLLNVGVDNVFFFGNGSLKKLERYHDDFSNLYFIPEAVEELNDCSIDFNRQIVLIYDGSVGWGNDTSQEIIIDGRIFYKNTDEYLSYLFTKELDDVLVEVGRAQANFLPKINLIGHSRGGLINLLYACQRPEVVQNLISLGTPYVGSEWASSLLAGSEAYIDLLDETHPAIYAEKFDVISDFVHSFAIGFNQTNEYLSGSLTKILYDILLSSYDDMQELILEMSTDWLEGDDLVDFLEESFGYNIRSYEHEENEQNSWDDPNSERSIVRNILMDRFGFILGEDEDCFLPTGVLFWQSFFESPYYNMGPVRGLFEYVVDYCHSTASPIASQFGQTTIYNDERLFPRGLKQYFDIYFALLNSPLQSVCGIRFRDGYDSLVSGLINSCSDIQQFCFFLNQYFSVPFDLPDEFSQFYPVVADINDYDPIRSDTCVDTESQIGYKHGFRPRLYDFDEVDIITFNNSSDSYQNWFDEYYRGEPETFGIAHNFETKNRNAIEDIVSFLSRNGGFHEHRGYTNFNDEGHWHQCRCGIQKNHVSHDVSCNNLGRVEGHEFVCSGCGYRTIDRHNYSSSLRLNSTNHISTCRCGISILETHCYTYLYVGLVRNPSTGSIARSHKANCRCGYSYTEPCQYVGTKCERCNNHVFLKPSPIQSFT